MKQAEAQTLELTEVAVNTSTGLMSGETSKILGAIIIILCAYIIYLHRRSDKNIDRHIDISKDRDDKFTKAFDKNSDATTKMSDVIADIARNNRL